MRLGIADYTRLFAPKVNGILIFNKKNIDSLLFFDSEGSIQTLFVVYA